MIETADVEINVDELMRRIREEVARRKATFRLSPGAAHSAIGRPAMLPRISLTSPLLEVKESYRLVEFLGFYDEDFVNNAYRHILRRQPDADGFEHYVSGLRKGDFSKVEILGRLRFSSEGRAKRIEIRGMAAPFISRMIGKVPVIGYLWQSGKILARMPVLVRNMEHFEAHVVAQDKTLHQQINDALVQIENGFKGTASAEAMRESHQALAEALRESQQAMAEAMRESRQASADAIGSIGLELERVNHAIANIGTLERIVVDLKRSVLDQHGRLALLLEETRKRLLEPISQEQIENIVKEEDHLLDAFYVSLEDRFRGTREDIKKRAEVYLPVIKDAEAGTPAAPILDIGCGRGEWLELLKGSGLTARGIDLNRIMVTHCREIGLEVLEAEAIDYLRSLKPDALGAVTGMHVIEHIPFRQLVTMLDETLRVLKPGGVAIFETPNPENLLVGACNFYFDPTHLNPLPPLMIQFVAEMRGFSRVGIRYLNEHRLSDPLMLLDPDEPGAQKINPVIQLAKNNYYSAPDYAVVAYKA